MNLKILAEVEKMLQTSPQLLKQPDNLKHAITGIFDIRLDDIDLHNRSITDIVNTIDDRTLERYFSEVWQPNLAKFKYSGLALVEEVNNLCPRNVLDVGCGYNEFKGKIKNLVGIDPYNKEADYLVSVLEFKTDEKFDVVLALGSINFGSTEKIVSEIERVVDLTAPGGKIFFRVNPGLDHEPEESKWISFYPWNSNFIINLAQYFGLTTINLQRDYKDRIYFVWSKPDK